MHLMIIVLSVLISSFPGAAALIVRVSAQRGHDTETCLRNSSSPCQTLHFALDAGRRFSNDSNLRVEILDEIYRLNHTIAIGAESRDMNLITITSGVGRLVVLTCDEAGGVNISDVGNIVFENLKFQDCSPNLAAVVLLWRSQNVTFQGCTFRNNHRSAINAFDSSVAIKNCTFRNNTSNARTLVEDRRFMPGQNVSAGGGTAFVFRDAKNLTVTIVDSHFVLNKAVVNDSEFFIDHVSNVSHFTNGGGGILVVFSGITENCEVVINDTRVSNNSASYGGGIYVAVDNDSKHNRFVLDHSWLVGNLGSQAGGAMGITQWDKATGTAVEIRNSDFEENWSRRGGGLNVYFNNKVESVGGSELTFRNVSFDRNRGKSSAALRLASSLPHCAQIPIATIDGCRFTGHTQTEESAFTAPLTSQKVSIVFRGHNVFANNTDAGAAEFENNVLHVRGRLEFLNNSGVQGGALLLRFSQMKLYSGSDVSRIFFPSQHPSVNPLNSYYLLQHPPPPLSTPQGIWGARVGRPIVPRALHFISPRPPRPTQTSAEESPRPSPRVRTPPLPSPL